MTATDLVALSGVRARDALTGIVDADTVAEVIRLESAGMARTILLTPARAKLKRLGVPATPIPLAPATPPDASALTVRCTRDKITPATGEEEIGRVFGFRTLPTKAGPVRRHQPQCKRCRAMDPIAPRASK